MVTIYTNWTGVALVSGATLDEARAKLTSLDCLPDTVFGDGLTDMTALDTGPHSPTMNTRANYKPSYDLLHVARAAFPRISATGRVRMIDAA